MKHSDVVATTIIENEKGEEQQSFQNEAGSSIGNAGGPGNLSPEEVRNTQLLQQKLNSDRDMELVTDADNFEASADKNVVRQAVKDDKIVIDNPISNQLGETNQMDMAQQTGLNDQSKSMTDHEQLQFYPEN